MRVAVATAFAAAFAAAWATALAAPPPADGRDAPINLPLDTASGPGGSAGGLEARMLEPPSNFDLQREYPQIARLMNFSGAATMTCKALASGRLDDCHVVTETPAGMGFGAASIRTAVYFRVRPAMRDGKPVDGVITIPMRWQTDETATPVVPPVPDAPPAALALGRRIVELEGVADRMRSVWSSLVQQQTAMLVQSGDAQAGQTVMDAFNLGLRDAIEAEADRQAHEYAAHESEAELNAVIAFLSSPAGKAWLEAKRRSDTDAPKDFYQRVATAARVHFCPDGTCPSPRPSSAGGPSWNARP